MPVLPFGMGTAMILLKQYGWMILPVAGVLVFGLILWWDLRMGPATDAPVDEEDDVPPGGNF